MPELIIPQQARSLKVSKYNTAVQSAIFLDRDGVIIENRPEYVRSWADVEFLPHALTILARIAALPYRIIVVTNQAGVGRGIITQQTVAEINQKLVEEIRNSGGRVDGIYVCPHTPDEDCDCRKPKPGLIRQAADEFALDLERSFLIGDSLSDIEAGVAAGIPRLALVRTGLGSKFEKLLAEKGLSDVKVYDNLAEALMELIPQT